MLSQMAVFHLFLWLGSIPFSYDFTSNPHNNFGRLSWGNWGSESWVNLSSSPSKELGEPGCEPRSSWLQGWCSLPLCPGCCSRTGLSMGAWSTNILKIGNKWRERCKDKMELKEMPWRDFAYFPNNLGLLLPNTVQELQARSPGFHLSHVRNWVLLFQKSFNLFRVPFPLLSNWSVEQGDLRPIQSWGLEGLQKCNS